MLKLGSWQKCSTLRLTPHRHIKCTGVVNLEHSSEHPNFSREIPSDHIQTKANTGLTSPLPEIHVTMEVIVLLDPPIGPSSSIYCSTFVSSVQKIQCSLQLLLLLKNSQTKVTLVHSFLSFPKVSSCFLTCPPRFIHGATGAFDSVLSNSLSDTLNGPVKKLIYLFIVGDRAQEGLKNLLQPICWV